MKSILLCILVAASPIFAQNFWQRTEPYFATLNRFSFAGGDTVYGALSSGFTRSTNNGDTWTAHLIVNYVQDMAVAPNGTIFMAQNQQKISRSTNKGNSFSVLGTGINEPSCSSVLTTQTGSVLVGTQKGIYRSTNNGDSWMKVAGPSELQGDSTVSSFTKSGATLYAATNSNQIYPAKARLLRSTDDGVTWSKGSSTLDTVSVYKIIALPNGTVVARTSSGVRATTNGGDTWNTLGFYNNSIYDVAVSPDGILYICYNDNNEDGLFRSTDNGGSWSRISSPAFGSGTIAVNPSGHLFIGREQTYRSTNQGATWKALPVGFPNVTIFKENAKKELFMTSGGIAYQTLYRSSDFGNSWSPMNTGVVGIPNIGFYGDTILVGDNYYSAKMFRSTDNGVTFKNVSGMSVITGYINALLGTSYRSILAGTSTGIYRSVDHGKVWKQVSNFAVTTLHQQPNGSMFAFRSAFGAGMVRSVDSGSTWTEVKNGMGNTTIYSLAFAPNGDIFAGCDGSLFRTTNSGDAWVRIDTQMNVKPNGIYITVNRDGKLFYGGAKNGTNSETYQSTDGGVSWSYITNNIMTTDNSASIKSLFVASNGRLFAGTSSGLFRSTSLTTGISSKNTSTVSPFELSQNYPNPFNPSTTIRWNIPSSGMVTLKVFDQLGREVAVLAERMMEAGSYQLQFDGSHLSSGIYYYVLSTGANADGSRNMQTKAMTLIK
ncbi:MAG: VPS10 domain-containing protein [Bacteroidota bacterium]